MKYTEAIGLFIIAIVVLFSCRSTRKIQTAITGSKVDTTVFVPVDQGGIDSVSVIQTAMNALTANRKDYSAFSAKMSVDYTGGDGKKYDVNAIVRMQKDSAIWISITALLNIEGLRALITKDSVKILNKQEKVYTARSVSYLREITNLPLDLATLQDIIVGNPVFIDGKVISYAEKEGAVTLYFLGDIFKNLLTVKDGKITNSRLEDNGVEKKRICILEFGGYDDKAASGIATKRRITVTEKNTLDIKLDIKSYTFNEKLTFPFSIPKGYKAD